MVLLQGTCECAIRVDGCEGITKWEKAWHTRSQYKLKIVSVFQSGGMDPVDEN